MAMPAFRCSKEVTPWKSSSQCVLHFASGVASPKQSTDHSVNSTDKKRTGSEDFMTVPNLSPLTNWPPGQTVETANRLL